MCNRTIFAIFFCEEGLEGSRYWKGGVEVRGKELKWGCGDTALGTRLGCGQSDFKERLLEVDVDGSDMELMGWRRRMSSVDRNID